MAAASQPTELPSSTGPRVNRVHQHDRLMRGRGQQYTRTPVKTIIEPFRVKVAWRPPVEASLETFL